MERQVVRRCASAFAAVILTVAALSLPRTAAADAPDSGPQVVSAAGSFYPTDVRRLLGTTTAGYAVSAGRDATVRVVGRDGIPSSGLSAALVNVTAAAGSSAATLTAFPSGRPTAETSLLSVPAGSTRSALLTVPLGVLGSFDMRDSGGPVAVTVDIVGFYAADDTVVASRGVGGGYQPVEATRLFDSREVPSQDTGRAPGALPAQGRTRLSVDLGQAINSHVTALALQVSAVAPPADGSLTVWGGGPAPDLTSVSFSAGAGAANLAVVPTSSGLGGTLDVSVANLGPAPVDVTVDVIGFYDDGRLGPNLRFRPLAPTRVVDTRLGLGAPAVGAGPSTTITAPPSVTGDNTFGLVGVVTTLAPSAPSELSFWPEGSSRPEAAGIAVGAGAQASTPVQTEVGPSKTIQAHNAVGSTDILLDVTGSFEAYPPVTDPSTRAWVRPLSSWQVSAVAH